MKNILYFVCFLLIPLFTVYPQATFERILYKPERVGLNCVKMISPAVAIAVGQYGVTRYTMDSANTWNNSLIPEMIDLNSVSYVDSSDVICVGNNGIIYHSTNLGINWVKISSPTPNDLMEVTIYDNLSGLIVGRNGTILITSDGGYSWTQKESKTGNDLLSVSYGTKDTVFSIGMNGTIIKSVDGGNTWFIIQSPVNKNFQHVKALGDKVFVAGDELTVLVSDDSGLNWQIPNIESNYSNLYYKPIIVAVIFFDSLNGFIRVSDHYKTTEYEYYTRDGGYTWHSYNVYHGIFGSPCDFFPTSYDFYSKDYGLSVDGNGCIYKLYMNNYELNVVETFINFFLSFSDIETIDGQNISVGFDRFSPSTLLLSSNAGKSWYETSRIDSIGKERGVPNYADLAYPQLNTFFVAMNSTRDTSYKHGDTTFLKTFYYGYILKSTDNGNTWTEFLMPDSCYAIKIEMGSEFEGILYIDNSRYMRTKNSGETWEHMPYPDSTVDHLRYVSCPKTNMYILIAFLKNNTNSLYISHNSGNNWEKIDSIPPEITSLLCINDAKMIGIGAKKFNNSYLDIIKETTDGGYSWNDLIPPDQSYMQGCRGIKKFDDNNFAVYTRGSYFYKTKDGGKTWDKIDVPWLELNETIEDITVLSSDELILVGYMGTMLRYKSGTFSVEYKPEIKNNSIMLYPNPFEDNVNLIINSDYDLPCRIQLIDLNGTIISKKETFINKGMNHLLLEPGSMNTGFYLVNVNIGGRNYNSKILKR